MPGRAAGTLDVGGVEADVFNTGALFYGSTGTERYEVPKGEGVAALFSASVWIGGTVDGDLRVSGATYGQGGGRSDYFEFWPGPLDEGSADLPDASDCSAYDRIWVVSAQQVADYERGGTAAQDLADWPVGLGAPTLDTQGQPVQPTRRDQRIDLAAGERPDLLGQQTAFWVMNDVGNEHRSFGTDALGIEVRVQAGAFLDPQSPTLTHATAYRYEIVNRSSERIDDLRVAIFASGSLGNAADDYVGTDPVRGLAFTYNSDNVDEAAYGVAPPALGFDLLSGASTSVYYPNGAGYGSTPGNAVQADRNMRGLWDDGTTMKNVGRGYNEGGSVTVWAYPAPPETGTYWSEVDAYPTAGRQPILPTVKEALITSTPATVEPGEAHAVDVALLYARGNDNYRSVTRLREASTFFQGQYDAGRIFPSRVRPVASMPTPPASAFKLAVTPNPSVDGAVVSFALAAPADVRVTLADVLGRTVRVLADGPRGSGEHRVEADVAGLAAGVYVVVVEAEGRRASQMLTIAR